MFFVLYVVVVEFLSTHADRQGVDISVAILLLLLLFVCVCTDFSAEDKASGIKFCTVVHRRRGQGISHSGELCSPVHWPADQFVQRASHT